MPKRIHFVVTAQNEDIREYDMIGNWTVITANTMKIFITFWDLLCFFMDLDGILTFVRIKMWILIDSYFVAIFMWLSGFCNYLPFKLPESLPFYIWTCCTVIAGASVYKSTSRPKNGGFNHIRWWGWNTTFPSNKEKGKTSCKKTYYLKYTYLLFVLIHAICHCVQNILLTFCAHSCYM